MLFEEDLSSRLRLQIDANNNTGDKAYRLRPRARSRRATATSTTTPYEDQPPKKQKSPPLSKYRRKTANARERSRMREINQAFETLRKAVPQLTAPQTTNNEKLTKITTLRLAMKYISTLSACLTADSSSNDSESSFDLDSNFFESDGGDSGDFCMDFDDPFAHFDPFLTEFS